tara:strand:- start:57 stop:212 length:156 start_codon:yes stop_codon:yes gene_type:complete
MLKINQTYKIKYKDEDGYFYACFIRYDRGFLCFERAGKIIACRKESIEILE